MIFVNKKALQKALNLTAKLTGIAGRVRPILGGVRLKSTGTHLEISATDLDVYFVTSIPISCSKDGSSEFDLVLDQKLLADAVKNAQGEISIQAGGPLDGNKIYPAAKIGTIQIVGQSSEDFPAKPDFPDTLDGVVFKSEELATAYKRTVFAVSKEASQYAYNGLLFEARGRMVATDGRRLAVYRLDDREQDWKAIFPRKAFEIAAGVAEKDFDFWVEHHSNMVRIGVEQKGIEIIARPIEGDFPAYEEIFAAMGKQYPVNMLRSVFIRAVEQVAALNKGKEVQSMEFRFDDKGGLTVFSEVEDRGMVQGNIEARFGGGFAGLVATFCPAYILDWIKVLEKKSAADLIMEFSPEKKGRQCTQATTFRDLADERLTYVLMPIT